jgi:hypothetical protein
VTVHAPFIGPQRGQFVNGISFKEDIAAENEKRRDITAENAEIAKKKNRDGKSNVAP